MKVYIGLRKVGKDVNLFSLTDLEPLFKQIPENKTEL